MIDTIEQTIIKRKLITPASPVILMVSGGSDSTALAYICADLYERQLIGTPAILHVNHKLRGKDADEDQQFVQELASLLNMPLFDCTIDIAALAQDGGNIEAIGRHERYVAAHDALESLCLHTAVPISQGRIITAHTQDDRIENFYMRSIKGTGPGGFRSMLYKNGPIVRPLLDVSRTQLRDYIEYRAQEGAAVVRDTHGNLWREDATNAHTDRFRAYVRHELIPVAEARNSSLRDTLCRTMNLIADEDDYMAGLADEVLRQEVVWIVDEEEAKEATQTASDGVSARVPEEKAPWASDGVSAQTPEGEANPAPDASDTPEIPELFDAARLNPTFGRVAVVLQRRVVRSVLQAFLGSEARVDTSHIEAVLAAFDTDSCKPCAGYVANITGNLAVSANKQGVLIEPMQRFRARRKPEKQ